MGYDDDNDGPPDYPPGVEGLQQIDPLDDPGGMAIGGDGEDNLLDASDKLNIDDSINSSNGSNADLINPDDDSEMGDSVSMDNAEVGEPVENEEWRTSQKCRSERDN